MMSYRRALFLLIVAFLDSIALAGHQTPSVEMNFVALTTHDAIAAEQYRSIWATDGARIIEAMQKHTGLVFEEKKIEVIVREAVSNSGFGSTPMILRSSYPLETKKATLIHELGHRLQGRFFAKDEEDHPYLFLYLYDVWVDLYGQKFAEEQVRVESLRKGIFDYETAWKDALALTASGRSQKWRQFMLSKHQE
jgi:hypothetical protein